MSDEHISTDKIVEVYIKIRDERSKLKEEFEDKDKVLSEKMQMLSEKLLEVCHEVGADSIKTAAGTIMRKVDTRYWTTDWEAMYDFISEHDVFPLLEKRLHQTNLKQFLEENPDVLPIGLQADRKFTITIRRSK
jgi:hypothetical protein